MSSLPSTRPSSWKSAAPPPPANTTTFAAQSALPKLPVPDLNATLTKLKASLKPLAWTAEELKEAEKKIEEFAGTQGKVLQERLLKRREETQHWLESWWDDGGYLTYRDSVVVNVSYYYGFGDHPAHLSQTPAGRAAAISRAALIFRQKLKRGILNPDTTKEGPICMDTFRWMFDCSRVPLIPNDYSVTHAKPGDTGDSGHIIVFRKNRPWKIEPFQNGRLLSTEELEKQFQYIYDNTTKEYPGIGVLTASNRDVWAKDYQTLSLPSPNPSIIDAIQSSAFTISLDTSTPSTHVEHSSDLWHGSLPSSANPTIGLRNRWCDKPVQFIIFDNARAGIMGEHSVMDGTPTVTLCDDVLNMLADKSFDHGSPSLGTLPPTIPKPLDWTVTKEIEKAIKVADEAALELCGDQTLGFHSTAYGKEAIKKFRVSPDSWAQMIIQLAYARLVTSMANATTFSPSFRTGGTYEAASTRRYFKGRTEAIRVVSEESDMWVKSMMNTNVGKADRKALFAKAVKKHAGDAREGGMGNGVDRHLFGLKHLVKQGEPVPALFTDPLLVRSSKWVLSTSSIFSKHFRVYGWGEVVPDGFGVAYMTGFDDRLQYTVTSRKEMPNKEFCREISKAAEDLYALHADERTRAKL